MPSNKPYKRRCKFCRKLDLVDNMHRHHDGYVCKLCRKLDPVDDNWHICLNCGGYYNYPEEGNDKFCEICIEKYLLN